MAQRCPKCREECDVPGGKIAFRDECSHCGADLHVCLACAFYDPSTYNACREPQADRVVDKERANFCEYFQPSAGASEGPAPDPADEARRRLDELFRKK